MAQWRTFAKRRPAGADPHTQGHRSRDLRAAANARKRTKQDCTQFCSQSCILAPVTGARIVLVHTGADDSAATERVWRPLHAVAAASIRKVCVDSHRSASAALAATTESSLQWLGELLAEATGPFLLVLGHQVPHAVHDQIVRQRERARAPHIPFWVVRASTREERRGKGQAPLPFAGGDDRGAELIRLVRRGEGPLLLEGETGTGKTESARLLHQIFRPAHRFTAQNCAALPKEYQESFLRGVAAKTFTNVGPRKSIFEQCHEGTLLLDEFQEFSPESQATLLDLLYPFTNDVSGTSLGSGAPWTANVQTIVATSHPVEFLLAQRRLRPEILARIPRRHRFLPLREALADVAARMPDRRSEVMRHFLLTMQERHWHWPAGSGDEVVTKVARTFMLQFQDGKVEWTLRNQPNGWDDLMPIPEDMLGFEWPMNYRQIEAVAFKLLHGTGRVGRWLPDDVASIFEEEERASSALVDRLQSSQPPLAGPDRLLGLAWLGSMTRHDASAETIGATFGLDARTVRRRLLRVRSDEKALPIAALSAEERKTLRAAADRIVAPRSRGRRR